MKRRNVRWSATRGAAVIALGAAAVACGGQPGPPGLDADAAPIALDSGDSSMDSPDVFATCVGALACSYDPAHCYTFYADTCAVVGGRCSCIQSCFEIPAPDGGSVTTNCTCFDQNGSAIPCAPPCAVTDDGQKYCPRSP
jgi:hypothetical protein